MSNYRDWIKFLKDMFRRPIPLSKCPECNQFPDQDFDGIGHKVYCRNCYDWAPDEKVRSPIGIGLSIREAIKDWNDQIECIKECND